MILITTAAYDRDLQPLTVTQLGPGMAMAAPIPLGDFVFSGVWDGGAPISVCGEIEKVPHLIKGIDDGTMVYKFQKIYQAGYQFAYLIIEDQWGEVPGGSGLTRVMSKGGKWHRYDITYSRINTFLDQLELYLGVKVRHTRTRKQTVKIMQDLYMMFQKPPSEHSSLNRFYEPPITEVRGWLDRVPSFERRVFKEIEGIGWKLSKEVEKKFPTVRQAAEARLTDWMDIPGIGVEIGSRAVQQLNGPK